MLLFIERRGESEYHQIFEVESSTFPLIRALKLRVGTHGKWFSAWSVRACRSLCATKCVRGYTLLSHPVCFFPYFPILRGVPFSKIRYKRKNVSKGPRKNSLWAVFGYKWSLLISITVLAWMLGEGTPNYAKVMLPWQNLIKTISWERTVTCTSIKWDGGTSGQWNFKHFIVNINGSICPVDHIFCLKPYRYISTRVGDVKMCLACKCTYRHDSI